MATTKVSVQEYLGTHYRPDVEYIEGELQERNGGEIEHAEMILAVLAQLPRYFADFAISRGGSSLFLTKNCR